MIRARVGVKDTVKISVRDSVTVRILGLGFSV